MDDTLSKLQFFIDKTKSSLAPSDFYHAVNQAYHDSEAELYDVIHSDMYAILDFVFDRLLANIFNHIDGNQTIRVLDVGAGTGLFEDYLFRKHKNKINEIVVVDPNIKMSNILLSKNKSWGFPIKVYNDYLDKVYCQLGSFDLVVCSSVLHHIPELKNFLSIIEAIIARNGYFLTAQDPRAEAADDSVALIRKAEFQSCMKLNSNKTFLFSKTLKILLSPVAPFIKKLRKTSSLEQQVNSILIRNKDIKNPLTMNEIWAITDIHVPNQPGGIGTGISKTIIEKSMTESICIDYFTYNFFDANFLKLDNNYHDQEMLFRELRDPHGFLFGMLLKKV